MNETTCQTEFARVMTWLAEHPTERSFLLNPRDRYTAEDYMEVLQSLQRDSMEFFIPLILCSTLTNWEMEQTVARVFADALGKQWDEMGGEVFVYQLLSMLKEETAHRERVMAKVNLQRTLKERCTREKAPEIPDGI